MNKSFLRAYLITVLVLALLGVGFASGYLTRGWMNPEDDFPILKQAYAILTTKGLKELPTAPALEYGMVHGMVQAYNDPYTIFVEPVQHELETNSLQGSFGGIGVNLANDGQGHWIMYPFPDGPAQKAGVQDGDVLAAVDELTLDADTTVDMIQSAIRGPVGTEVNISVIRTGAASELQFVIERAEIALPSVIYHLDQSDPRVGVVSINRVAATSPDETLKAFEALRARGATHFVLDLRNNGGGLLTSGVDIARLFLEQGVVMQQQYRNQEVETFRVEKPGALAGLPLVVLINHGTASAAEIIAGALQQQGRAQLVGSPSYGKSTIQLIFDLEDGSSLHVTAARWWIPDLQPEIAGNGLQPSVSVTPGADANAGDVELQAAISVLSLPGQ